MRKLLPVLLALVGLGAGVAGGFLMRPEAHAAADPSMAAEAPSHDGATKFMPMTNQFVIPLVESGRVNAMIVLTVSLEILPDSLPDLQAQEPKLRDSFLQVMFDHANAGGFRGNFTSSNSMQTLRTALGEAGRKIAGPSIRGVLISDILRQES